MLVTQVPHIILSFLCGPASSGYITHMTEVIVVGITRCCLVELDIVSHGAYLVRCLPIRECVQYWVESGAVCEALYYIGKYGGCQASYLTALYWSEYLV